MERLNTVLLNASRNGNLKVVLYERNDFLNSPINCLSLSNRPMNGLLRSGYSTIKDVYDNWDNIISIKKLGKKSSQEIQYGLICYLYSLLNDVEKERYLKDIINANYNCKVV